MPAATPRPRRPAPRRLHGHAAHAADHRARPPDRRGRRWSSRGALLRLIGLITNAVFYQRGRHRPGRARRRPPHRGGWCCSRRSSAAWSSGVMARYGSEKIRGHGMPEAIEAILIGGSKVQPRVARAQAGLVGDRDRHRRPVRRRGPDHHDRRRRRLAVRAAPAPDRRRAQDPARRRRRGRHGRHLQLAARRAPARRRAAAVRVAAAQPGPGRGRGLRRHRRRASRCSAPARSSRSAAPLHLTHVDVPALRGLRRRRPALLAVVATALVYASEDAFRRLPLHWMWWPAIGGLVIGIGGLFVPAGARRRLRRHRRRARPARSASAWSSASSSSRR